MGLKENLEAQYSDIVRTSPSQSAETTLESIEVLQNNIKQNIGQLSKFDQEHFSNNIQKLKEQLWSKKKPARFQFKNKLKMTPPTTTAAASSAPESSATTPSQQGSGIANGHSNGPKQVDLLEHAPQTNVHLSNLTKSTLIYSQVSGPAYIENVTDSRIIVSSHQCRVKSCHDVEIWLERCAHPVIEDSDGVTFVLPLSGRKTMVSDFSWLQSEEASPHYTIINSSSCEEWKPFKQMTEEDLKELAGTARKPTHDNH